MPESSARPSPVCSSPRSGLASCFIINGVSYVACIVGLALMQPADLVPAEPRPREKGQLREGFRYVWGEPALRTPLLVMAAIGTLTYEFQITLPLVAQYTFGAGAGGYGALTSAMGVGAVVGGLIAANRGRPTRRLLGIAALVFGAMVLVASVMPTFGAMLAVLPLVGAASITFISLSNTSLQLAARPEMRGRVMALYSVAFLGSTPVGGPIVGWVGQAIGPRAALVLGGVTAVAAASLAWRSLNRPAPAIEPAHDEDEVALVEVAEIARIERLAAVEAELIDAEQADGDPIQLMPLAS